MVKVGKQDAFKKYYQLNIQKMNFINFINLFFYIFNRRDF